MPAKKKKPAKKEAKSKIVKIEKFKIFNDDDNKQLKSDRVKAAIAQLDFERMSIFFNDILVLTCIWLVENRCASIRAEAEKYAMKLRSENFFNLMKLPVQIRKMTVKQFKEQYNEDLRLVLEEDTAKRLQPLIGNAYERPGSVAATPKRILATPLRPSFSAKKKLLDDNSTPSRPSTVARAPLSVIKADAK